MLISMNWIRDFVDLEGLDAEQLIHQFTLSTAEVEEIQHKGADISGIVSAKITECEMHPQSKKLHILKVDDGSQIHDVVCGAPNARTGITVALARLGAQVGELTIGEVRLAGIPSRGMCCSEAELGISADHDGILELPEGTPLGIDIKQLLPIDDIVFEVDNKSLTNRPDLWGHYGIAREFAVLSGRPLRALDVQELTAYASRPPVQIETNAAGGLLYRYSALKMGNIRRKTAPDAMRVRLYYCGMRAINLLTDLTNYVMLELGQPMHAFDARRVGQIEVRQAGEAVLFRTLDGTERNIPAESLLICSGGTPVAIAGVMGGEASAIAEDTESLLLESANFDSVSVRKTSQSIGLRTDASQRYEKTLDPELTVPAIGRFVRLLLAADPGAEITARLTDAYPKQFPKVAFPMQKTYIDRMAGLEVPMEHIKKTLRGLGFGLTATENALHIEVPSWRATKDVSIPADIVEEVMRVYGYDNIEPTTAASALQPVRPAPERKLRESVKDLLSERFCLHEAQSYIWYNTVRWKKLGLPADDGLRLANAQAAQCSVLRTSIIPSLLDFAEANKNIQPEFGLFEIGKCFPGTKPDGSAEEREALGVVLFSKTADAQALYLRLRDIVAYLGQKLRRVALEFAPQAPTFPWQHAKNTCAVLAPGGEALGFLSLLGAKATQNIEPKATVAIAQIDMRTFTALAETPLRYHTPPKFPGIDYDLTLLRADNIRYAEIEKVLRGVNSPYLQQIRLIDLYEGEKPSITLRLAFQSEDKSLTFEEIKQSIQKMVEALNGKGIYLKA
ncbi:MAG: phenylalanine--tRNA ligase subunit beta [Oscillospiraceae bacterium]|jgi:phenylalanyl-tRNA synthetase beta chain|nr:phenylalanine--tRNA ligase subunit beta [Oscillospiraceae bacterium]